MQTRFTALLVFFALIEGCAVNPVTGKSDFVTMSEAQEISLGKRYHPQIIEQYGVYENPPLQSYVQHIGEQLSVISHRKELIYRFTLLDSPVVNAFALPGGYIYITRGIMAYMNSEAELAGVLGHEIGHVTARHSVRQHASSTAANIFGMVVAVKTGSRAASDLAQLFGGALVRGYGREHELESDRLGAEYLARVGYDPESMLGVIGLLKNQEEFEAKRAKEEGREPQTYHGVFATHPDNDQRLQEVIRAARNLGNIAGKNTGRETYLKKIDGMIFGESEKHGVSRHGFFYHPVLGFTFTLPQNWRIDNLPDRLIISRYSNDAFMQLTVDDLNKHISAETYFKERLNLAKLPQNGETLTINGLQAYTAIAEQNTAIGKRNMRFVVIFLENRAYLFSGFSKNNAEFSQMDPQFLATAKTFHPITEDEKKHAQPYRITITIADGKTRYSELAKHSPLPNYAEARLRLLNGHYPKGEPEPGQLIKIIK